MAWRLRIIFSVLVCTCLEIEKAPETFYKKRPSKPLIKLGLASNYVPNLFNNSFIIHIVSFHTYVTYFGLFKIDHTYLLNIFLNAFPKPHFQSLKKHWSKGSSFEDMSTYYG